MGGGVDGWVGEWDGWVASLAGAWRYRASAGTGRPGITIL